MIESISRGRPGLLFVLGIASFCLYFSVYSARIESGDALLVVDAASSFGQFGDLERDESLWLDSPTTLTPTDPYPLLTYEQNEPLIVWISSLFYQLATSLPQIGLVHGMYLLNLVVSTLIVLTVCGYVRVLGNTMHIALLTALVCGFATIIWPYSKTLFRESLVTLFLLLSALCLELFRQRGLKRGWWVGGLGVLLYGLACLTKNSAIFALPAFILIIYPWSAPPKAWRRLMNSLIIMSMILLGIVAFWSPTTRLVQPFIDLLPLNIDLTVARTALHTYLFSIGGSVWGTSPALLLALPGAYLLLHQRQHRSVWVVYALLMGYALGHGLLTGVHWFGGLSWPPRFLVPTVPFICLLLPPIFVWLQSSLRIWRWLSGGLVGYSVIIQLIAVVSRLDAYNELLPPEADNLSEWSVGLNTIDYLRWVVLPRSWSTIGFDVAWVRADSIFFGAVLILLGLVLVRLCWHWVQHPPNRHFYWVSALPVLLLTFFGLQQLYERDPEYWAYKAPLFDILTILKTNAQDGQPQPLLLADRTYDEFILNYNRLEQFRPLVLGFQPGEAVSEQVPPRVVGDYPPALLEAYVPRFIDQLAHQHDRIWLLAHNSPFITWSVRPVERYLSQNFYLLREFTTEDPTVRLLEYSTIAAPDRYTFRLPDYTTDLRYGDQINLRGFTLPAGTTYQAGDVVPISLFWQTEAQLGTDYVVAWFVVGKDGLTLPIQGIDTMPDSGFAPTMTWQPSVPIWDNHALVLPHDLPTGDYDIWVLMYPLALGGSERLPVTGRTTLDGTIGVLPISLQIVAQNS